MRLAVSTRSVPSGKSGRQKSKKLRTYMSNAERKKRRREQFLQQHPDCIYCGAPADTIDHCPPRGFFEGRQWPETYEFPACNKCNGEARLDEQAMAVLVRIKLSAALTRRAKNEWEKLVDGVKNNQPDLWAEWTAVSNQKRAMHEALGSLGGSMRQAGWGSINLGRLTDAVIARFVVKLGKALYYRNNGTLFDGIIYSQHISILKRDVTPEFIAEILRLAPAVADLKRGNQSLVDQFLYRFNNSSEHGALYAVAQFSEQFIFQVVAVRRDMAQKLTVLTQTNGRALSDLEVYDCHLLHKPRTALAESN